MPTSRFSLSKGAEEFRSRPQCHILTLLQLLFLHTFWSFANQPLLQLLPVRQARALLVFLFCTVTLQVGGGQVIKSPEPINLEH